MPTLLVPVDLSEGSRGAVEAARRLAGPLGAEIVLLHVFEPPPPSHTEASPPLVARHYQRDLPAAERALADLAAACGGVPVLVRQGSPGPEILRAVGEIHADYVVMGTHGRRGLRRLALGSVAEQVIRSAVIPVVTVRGPSRAA